MWAGRTICFNKKSEESVLFALFSVGGSGSGYGIRILPVDTRSRAMDSHGAAPIPQQGKMGESLLAGKLVFGGMCRK